MKTRYSPGDKVRVIAAECGALGANGKEGVILSDFCPYTHGLRRGYRVLIENRTEGSSQVWGVGDAAILELVVDKKPVDNRKLHPLGGGPTRCTTLPEGAADRKTFPVASGFMDYFPDAIAAISNLSHKANEQHNAGQPVHWARGKSSDHSDTMVRHFLQRGTIDKDGQRHTVKMAWRALAMLQEEIEAEHTTTATFTSHAQAPNAR